MASIFGGGNSDNGAAAAAAAAAQQAQERAAASQQAQWKMQQDAITKQQADAAAQQQKEAAQAQQSLDAARQEQAAQQKAQQATGSGVSNSDLSNATAKGVAIAQQTGQTSGLPGFNSLAQRVQGQNQNGFAGQSNSLVAQSGFNAGQPGGRKYT